MAVQLKPGQERQLQQIAAQGARSADELAQEAVDNFLAYNREFVAAVQEGLAAADRGELIDHEKVVAMMDDIVENG